MERASRHRRQHVFLTAFLLGFVPCSATPAVACSANSPDCSSFCEVSNACSCNVDYGRCACQNKAAALLLNGQCIATSAKVPSDHASCSKDGQLGASVLLVVGIGAPSPELTAEDLRTGKPSAATTSILHWCTASATGANFDKTRLAEIKLITARNSSSVLFFDISFSLCTEGVAELVHASIFERRFIEAWQGFAAFPITSLRLLELNKQQDAAADGQTGTVQHARSQPPGPPPAGSSVDVEKATRDPTFKELVWFWPALGAALLLLVCTVCRLVRHKYKNHGKSPHQDNDSGDIVPGPHPQEPPIPATVPQGPSGGSLASVAYDFDPCSTDGSPFVAAAGLEPSECLTVTKGDIFEAFARGEDWLYGRLRSSGLFGYLPEPCILWIDAVGGPAAVGVAPASGHPPGLPMVMGRLAHTARLPA